jgi:hypothetical protein
LTSTVWRTTTITSYRTTSEIVFSQTVSYIYPPPQPYRYRVGGSENTSNGVYEQKQVEEYSMHAVALMAAVGALAIPPRLPRKLKVVLLVGTVILASIYIGDLGITPVSGQSGQTATATATTTVTSTVTTTVPRTTTVTVCTTTRTVTTTDYDTTWVTVTTTRSVTATSTSVRWVTSTTTWTMWSPTTTTTTTTVTGTSWVTSTVTAPTTTKTETSYVTVTTTRTGTTTTFVYASTTTTTLTSYCFIVTSIRTVRYATTYRTIVSCTHDYWPSCSPGVSEHEVIHLWIETQVASYGSC